MWPPRPAHAVGEMYSSTPPHPQLRAPWWPLQHRLQAEERAAQTGPHQSSRPQTLTRSQGDSHSLNNKSQDHKTAGTRGSAAWSGSFVSTSKSPMCHSVIVVPAQHCPGSLVQQDPAPNGLANCCPSHTRAVPFWVSVSWSRVLGAWMGPQSQPRPRSRTGPLLQLYPWAPGATQDQGGLGRTLSFWGSLSCPQSCKRTDGPCSLGSWASTPNPRVPAQGQTPTQAQPPAGHSATLHTHPGPLEDTKRIQWVPEPGPQVCQCPVLVLCVGPRLRRASSFPDWSAPTCLADWPVPGEAWVPARLAKGGGQGPPPRLQASGTDCPRPFKGQSGGSLWLSCRRGTWLRKPLSPHNGPLGTCEGRGLRLVGPALTLASTLTLALITTLTPPPTPFTLSSHHHPS